MDSTAVEPEFTQPDHSADPRSDDGTSPLRRLEPSRQALFPTREQNTASLESLRHAEHYIRSLGFNVARLSASQWQIAWPGTLLKIWRYSAEEVCQFAQDQAVHYARRANDGARATLT